MKRAETHRLADLSSLSTFRLPARAAELIVLDSPEQLNAMPPADSQDLVLGGGSNTVFLGDFAGRVILNRLSGVSFESSGDDVLVTAAAGENWHGLVRRCIERGLHGLENLVMIPGSVGAAPMQNIGAYGVELADVFERLSAWDRQERRLVSLAPGDCAFNYRDSRFRSAEPGRFLITSVTLRLSTRFRPDTRYASLARALDCAGIRQPSARQLAAAVMRLRRHRLPDPARLPNAGSFFRNPVVTAVQASELLRQFPTLPHWSTQDGSVKLAAAWMIERLGFRGRRVGDAGVYHRHALVLVNHGRATARQLVGLVDEITTAVRNEFGIELDPEPQLIGSLQA
ncbi:MAG: UDP-N-acetylmuramate dehydrogenase [Pseudomonadota bacterium]|nr:MAG: UDP-N-acetylmuramate dehydrogenase [Pseudomonadota bacterium]